MSTTNRTDLATQASSTLATINAEAPRVASEIIGMHMASASVALVISGFVLLIAGLWAFRFVRVYRKSDNELHALAGLVAGLIALIALIVATDAGFTLAKCALFPRAVIAGSVMGGAR